MTALEVRRLSAAEPSWPVVKLKFLARLQGGGTPSKDNEAFWVGGDVPWVSPKDMKTRDIHATEDCITHQAVKESATSFVEPGCALIVARSGILRHTIPVAIARKRVTLNQDMKAFHPKASLDSEFLAYWIEGQNRELLLEWRQFGATVESLDTDRVMNARVALPDLPTQKRIAAFLDRETARIDELIALRTRFEAKVKESREALIASLLVGLPEENQRPSTTNWLENLPSQVARERAKVHFQERVQLSETGDEELLTVSHLTGVTRRSEKNVNMIMAESHEGYKLVQPNDLVINTMWAWMGAMGVSKEAGLISPAYGIYRPTSGKLLPEYVDLLVRSKPFVAEATRRSKGIHSSRLRLYPDAFLDMRLPVPTLEQQDSILKQIEARATREDTLVEKNAKATELLREYRTALITAAVTGQIDVDTYGKAGTTSETLDRIEEEMQA